MRVLKLTLGVNRRDRVRSSVIRESSNVTSVMADTQKSQQRRCARKRQMPQDRDLPRILDWIPNKRRPTGGTRTDCKRTVKHLVEENGLSMEEAQDL